MGKRRVGWFIGAIVWAWAGAGWALAPRPLPDDTDGYSYQPSGRRDPFLRFGEAAPTHDNCAGRDLAGVSVQAVALRGIVRTAGGPVALLVGPDQRTHFARPGDRLCDGRVAAIEPGAIRLLRDPSADGRLPASDVVQVLHP